MPVDADAPTLPAAAAALELLDQRFGVEVVRGLAFGQARIGHSTPATSTLRELRMDVYQPVGDPAGPRPALILAFGGAFHRGSRADDSVTESGPGNTPIAAYCDAFARRGYVAFSIDYRLVPEDPDPGQTPVVANPDSVPRSRVDVVRRIMGLPEASSAALWRGVEAASDDFAMAFRFIQSHADRWRIDAHRMAVGGFSAGARSAWNAAYGEGVPAAAVVSLSGAMHSSDLGRWLRSGRSLPPLLLVRGENDLDYVRAQNIEAMALCRSAGVDCVEAVVPGADHFYAASAATAAGSAPSVEDTIAVFLASRIRNSFRS